MNARPPYLRHTLTAMTFSLDILFISISHPNKSEFLHKVLHMPQMMYHLKMVCRYDGRLHSSHQLIYAKELQADILREKAEEYQLLPSLCDC